MSRIVSLIVEGMESERIREMAMAIEEGLLRLTAPRTPSRMGTTNTPGAPVAGRPMDPIPNLDGSAVAKRLDFNNFDL
jgi:hypothetical protein